MASLDTLRQRFEISSSVPAQMIRHSEIARRSSKTRVKSLVQECHAHTLLSYSPSSRSRLSRSRLSRSHLFRSHRSQSPPLHSPSRSHAPHTYRQKAATPPRIPSATPAPTAIGGGPRLCGSIAPARAYLQPLPWPIRPMLSYVSKHKKQNWHWHCEQTI